MFIIIFQLGLGAMGIKLITPTKGGGVQPRNQTIGYLLSLVSMWSDALNILILMIIFIVYILYFHSEVAAPFLLG